MTEVMNVRNIKDRGINVNDLKISLEKVNTILM